MTVQCVSGNIKLSYVSSSSSKTYAATIQFWGNREKRRAASTTGLFDLSLKKTYGTKNLFDSDMTSDQSTGRYEPGHIES